MDKGDAHLRLPKWLGTVACLLVLAPAAVAAVARSAGSAAAGGHLALSATSVSAQGSIRVLGRTWPCASDITLEAYVDGVSPYDSQAIGQVSPTNGAFSKRWKVPSVTDSLEWTVQAAQQCGRRTTVRTASLEINATRRSSRVAQVNRAGSSAITAAAGATTVDQPGRRGGLHRLRGRRRQHDGHRERDAGQRSTGSRQPLRFRL
jgi:hypothetical protein